MPGKFCFFQFKFCFLYLLIKLSVIGMIFLLECLVLSIEIVQVSKQKFFLVVILDKFFRSSLELQSKGDAIFDSLCYFVRHVLPILFVIFHRILSLLFTVFMGLLESFTEIVEVVEIEVKVIFEYIVWHMVYPVLLER